MNILACSGTIAEGDVTAIVGFRKFSQARFFFFVLTPFAILNRGIYSGTTSVEAEGIQKLMRPALRKPRREEGDTTQESLFCTLWLYFNMAKAQIFME